MSDVFSIEDIKAFIERASEESTYYLMHPRGLWEAERATIKQFNFTDEELDKAEKHESGFIGDRLGFRCLLTQRIPDA